MRAALLLIVVAACGKSDPPVTEWKLEGKDLDSFCHEQERKPGWTCEDYESCETAIGDDGNTVCRAKQLAPNS